VIVMLPWWVYGLAACFMAFVTMTQPPPTAGGVIITALLAFVAGAKVEEKQP
jgi:hypothetical protein